MTDGNVYMIGCFSGSYVKIGYSADPAARLKQLKTGCPFPLELLATVPGDLNFEQVLHLWFDDLRIDGEWFHFPLRDSTDQFRQAIERIATMDGCPFEWQELYVDVKKYNQPHRMTLCDRLARQLRTEPVNETRARLLAASRLLGSARELMRQNRTATTA